MRNALKLLILAVMCCVAAGCASESAGREEKAGAGEIRYYYNNLFATYDCEMTITPEGDVSIFERKGPAAKDIRHVVSHLTPEQRASLDQVFQGWKKLKPNYPGDWTLLIKISFDGHVVQANNVEKPPVQFKQAKAALDKIAQTALNVAATTPGAGQ